MNIIEYINNKNEHLRLQDYTVTQLEGCVNEYEMRIPITLAEGVQYTVGLVFEH